MRGDFSRIRFNRLKGYTAVLGQQGRVALDADANEQCFTDDYLRRTETVDVIGEYGAPKDDAGFAISIVGDEIEIGPGRYYVDGLLCENPTSLSYDDQPFLLGADPTATKLLEALSSAAADSVVQLYLETWQRFVTALDDPCLREPALGQADTTGRLQTVWRVVASEVLPEQKPSADTPAGLSPCCRAMYGVPTAQSTGTMSAETSGSSADCGCQPVAAAGYQGVENQLYRIEIHHGGADTEATFKWSRENGSVVAAVTEIAGSTVKVNSLGRDANLGVQAQQWVELSDDNDVFGVEANRPGDLYLVKKIQASDPSVTLAGAVTPVDPTRNARLRRWDQSGPAASSNGIPLAAGTWIELENGIQVSFTAGTYRSGDYWTIPARTATGTIEWPPCGSDGGAFQPPTSIQTRRAPLACIHWQPPSRPIRRLAKKTKETANRALAAKGGGVAAENPLAGGGVAVEHPLAGGGVAAENPLAGGGVAVEHPLAGGGIAVQNPLGRGGFIPEDCRVLFEPLSILTAPVTPQAMHVEHVSWVNDDVTTLDRLLADGLTVQLDQQPSSPISGANFIVTVEPAVVPARDDGETRFIALQPERGLLSTLLRSVTIVDSIGVPSEIMVDGTTLSWQLPYEAGSYLQRLTIANLDALILPGATAGLWARVRIRLLGQMIFAAGEAGSLFLDGRAFGTLAERADGEARIDLRLPSGDGERASDLDGWFYLAPTLAVDSLEVAYPELTVTADSEESVTVEAPGTKGKVSPEATVYLNYPAVAETSLALALTGEKGVGTVVSIPSSVEIKVSDGSVTFPITVLSDPGQKVTFAFEIAATITPAAGPPSSSSASFKVTGGPQEERPKVKGTAK